MRKRLISLFLMNGKIFPILFLDKKLQNMAHLTQEQRYTISVMIKQNHSQADIARTIGKCKSVENLNEIAIRETESIVTI